MCGIAGAFQFNGPQPVEEKTLRAMADAMVHRGPDDEGYYVSQGRELGLAFRRLAIVDLALGHQPMSTPDGRYTLVFNGEIYNHLEIRAELEAKGVAFKTHSDTEVLLHLYAHQGASAVERVNGMFAIAVWDAEDKTLFLARDRMGIKPLYYAVQNGSLVFASEIKCLFQHPQVTRELNQDELARYFTFLCLPAPETLFAGVKKLRAGHRVTIKAGGSFPAPERYWNPLPTAQSTQTEEALVEELRDLLHTSVKDRLMADVPFGAFLSGGVDSSAIVSIMSQLLDRPVETFSVGYKNDSAFNEFQHARDTAKRFGTNHHEVVIDHNDFKDFLPRLVHHQDEPIADPVCVPLYYVAELARKSGVIVALVGEGADELFFGYTFLNRVRRMVEKWWHPLSETPTWMRAMALGMVGPFVDLDRRDFLRRLKDGGEPFLGGAVTFYPEELKRLAPRLASDRSREAIVRDLYAEYDATQPKDDFPNRAGYLETMYRLPELLLMRVDKMTMATSVEGRVPFLDHRIVELAFRIPGALKVKDEVPKSILKKAVAPYLPDSIIHRKKVGFHVPVTRWFEEVLAPMADNVLFSPELEKLGIWDQKVVKELLAKQKAGSGNYGMRIWSLVNFGLWHRHWFEE